MSSGFSKYTVLVIVTVVIGFFVTWDLNRRQAEKALQVGGGTSEVEFVPDDAGEVVIPVSGMSCESCEMSIEHALKELDGVHQVDASHLKGAVSVRYDPERVSLSQMKGEIEKAGYTPGDPAGE